MSPALRGAANGLAAAAMSLVQEAETGRVRAEDYVTALAAMTGEAALVASGVIDVEESEIPPGAPVFGDPQNRILTGDTTSLAEVPPESVVGILVAELVPDTLPASAFDIEALYHGVAAGLGAVAWGTVPLSVPDANRPAVLPIRMAYELRASVDAVVGWLKLPNGQRHAPCALALAQGLTQVKGAIDLDVGARLALEVVFGMAKMAPMSRSAFEASLRSPNR